MRDCCWLCWTCMHKPSCNNSFVLCPAKGRQRHWALLSYICLAADIESVASCFTTTQHLEPDAGVQPLTCSACFTGCMLVPRLQKWRSNCARLNTTILTQSKTCGPLGCCSSLSSRARANFPLSMRRPYRMGPACFLPPNCTSLASTQTGKSR